MHRTNTRTDFFGPDLHAIISAVMFVIGILAVVVDRTNSGSSGRTSSGSSSRTSNGTNRRREEQEQDR